MELLLAVPDVRIVLAKALKFDSQTQLFIRLLLPLLVFQVANALLTSFLLAAKRFIASGLLPLCQSVVVITMLLGLQSSIGLTALIAGYFFGAAVQLSIARMLIVRWRFDFSLRNIERGAFSALWSAWPVGISAILINLNPLTDKIIANIMLGAGNVTVLENATRLFGVLCGLFYAPITNVLMSHWATFFARQQLQVLISSLRRAVVAALCVLLPLTIALLFLRVQITETVFGYGAYTQDQVLVTASTFGGLCTGLLPFFIGGLGAKYLYSIGHVTPAIWIAVLAVAINIPADIILAHHLGVAGIALATAMTYSGAACIAMVLSWKYSKRLAWPMETRS
jgi:putative peptidoglycan lipid II flippase